MMKIRQWALVAGALFMLSGCGSTGPQSNLMADLMAGKGGSLAQMDPEKMMSAMTEKMNFSQEMMKNPDLPVWHAQRKKWRWRLATGSSTKASSAPSSR